MQIRRFTATGQMTPLRQLQDWRQKRQAAASNVQALSAAASNAIAAAHINRSAGLSAIAMQASLKQAQDRIGARLAGTALDKLT